MDSPILTKPWSRGLQEEKNRQGNSERYKNPVPCMNNKRVVKYVRSEERSGRSGGRGTVHVKKNRGLAFQSRTGDQPEALLCPLFMKSVTKNIRVCGASFFFFFLGRLTNTPKFSVEFNKKIKNKGSLRQRADPLPNTPPV